jgi:hypothetical protein
MELSKVEILNLGIGQLYLELQAIKQQVIGLPIYLEENNQTTEQIIDFDLREKLYDQITYGINISINITDIINGHYVEKWKRRIVYFGDYNNRKKTDYYKFQEEIMHRKAIMVNIINTFYNHKEKAYA